MATPMTQAQWRSQAKKFGQPFVEKPSFKDSLSGRDDETGLYFGPVYGGLFHHTGDDAADYVDSRVIATGRLDLSGPLANTGCRDDGVLEFFTVGRANHAGKGDADVYRAIRTEDYVTLPKPDVDQIDGNDCLYGLEVYFSGSHPPTAAAYKAMVNWGAMICDFHDWTAKSLIAHKEWTYRKIDPGNVNMYRLRDAIDARIAAVNAALSDATVKIFSWNVGNQSQAAILRELRNMLGDAKPDVVCLQEAYGLDELSAESYNFKYHVFGPDDRYPNYISEHPANAILCRNTGVVKAKGPLEMLTPWQGPNLRLWHSPRVHRYVTFNKQEINFRVMDFHGLPVNTGKAESLEAAKDWMIQMGQLGPAIAVGDYNDDNARVTEVVGTPSGSKVDGGGIDLAVYKNVIKVDGDNFGLHGSDHNAKMWTFKV